MAYPFLKGHGTENDFVLLPDLDGTRARRAAPQRGCGRCATAGPASAATACSASCARPAPTAEWFMDYRNADGSLAEMCGNGIRVFARYLVDAGLADGRRRSRSPPATASRR